MAIAAASSLSLGSTHYPLCHIEGPILHRTTTNWVKHMVDGYRAPDSYGLSFSCNCRNQLFGLPFHVGHDRGLSKVSVAADYSDSVPDSSNNVNEEGYHPLEEVRTHKRVRETKLSSAEVARTTVEANSSALLVFPGSVHCEPHEGMSWTELKYVTDDYGDIFFEIFDDENILLDPGASNPVNTLIGMDIPHYENRRRPDEYAFSDTDNFEGDPFDDDYFEVSDSEAYDDPNDWGMPETWIHPIHFAKCLTKAVNVEYHRQMDHPSNGVSILGCLRPAFADEESYLSRLFHLEHGDTHGSEMKDGQIPRFSSRYDVSNMNSTFYRLEILRIELFSVYGVQSIINLQDFQDAEPDTLVHSAQGILERFHERGVKSEVSLKAYCKKKGLHIEGANLIGVDSLGMDVRVFSGAEVQTHRFPFKARVSSEVAAEKQIQQLLFPRSRRKKFNTPANGLKDPY